MKKYLLLIFAIMPIAGMAQTWNTSTLSNYVRTLQGQATTAASKNTSQDAAISSLTTKVNSQANIITVQNSTISSLQAKIIAIQAQVDALTASHKTWRPTWMNPNDFKVINGPTTDSVSTIR